jgi:alkylhydroperoxidase/carboxymuconolactone decarboxylase family protein YurZ
MTRPTDHLDGFLGDGGPGWQALAGTDPALSAAYEALATAAHRGGHLPPKVRELVGIAAAAACSGIDPDGIRRHVRAATAAGATRDELVEVLRLVAIMGIHTCIVGMPLLLEELRAAGIEVEPASPERASEVRDDFERRRGYWSPVWEALATFDPEFLAAYLDFSSLPWEPGVLEPKVRELVYVAMNSVTTHLFPEGLRVHLRNALARGATAAEIVEVFELVSTIGIRSCLAALPIVATEAPS